MLFYFIFFKFHYQSWSGYIFDKLSLLHLFILFIHCKLFVILLYIFSFLFLFLKFHYQLLVSFKHFCESWHLTPFRACVPKHNPTEIISCTIITCCTCQGSNMQRVLKCWSLGGVPMFLCETDVAMIPLKTPSTPLLQRAPCGSH